jgi:hypothetical protein
VDLVIRRWEDGDGWEKHFGQTEIYDKPTRGISEWGFGERPDETWNDRQDVGFTIISFDARRVDKWERGNCIKLLA